MLAESMHAKPMTAQEPSMPRARTEGLLVQPLGDELVVYDQERQLAHSLGPVAAAVWRRCDGRTLTVDLLAWARRELPGASSELQIQQALEQLSQAGLLDDVILPGVANLRGGRRSAMRALGGAAGAALVATIVVPPARAHASGGSDRDCESTTAGALLDTGAVALAAAKPVEKTFSLSKDGSKPIPVGKVHPAIDESTFGTHPPRIAGGKKDNGKYVGTIEKETDKNGVDRWYLHLHAMGEVTIVFIVFRCVNGRNKPEELKIKIIIGH